MNNINSFNYILLVDDEADILGIEEITLKTCYDGKILKATSGNDALTIIIKNGPPEIVISDYLMPNGDGAFLFNYVKENLKETKFIICSGNPRSDLIKIFEGAHLIIEKPSIIKPLIQAVKEIGRKQGRPEAFVEVMIRLIGPSNTLPYDYYLKLSETNIIKVFKRGDAIYQEDLKKLQDKGLDFLYLAQDDCMLFLKEYERGLVERLAREMDPEKIVSFSFESFVIAENLARALGWNQEFINFAKKNISAAMYVLSKDVVISKIIESKLSDPSSSYNKHIFLTSLVGCAFCQYLGFSTEAAQMKIAMTALLHDINVDESCYQDIDSWNRNALSGNESDKEVVKYRNHPIETSNFVLSMKNLPPDVDQIIAQHHERPEGTGFPRGLTASRISHLASLFIICEDFSHLLLKGETAEKAIERFLLWGDEFYNSGNFKKIFAVLKFKLSLITLKDH